MQFISKKNIPNYITVFRILGAVCLLFLEPLSTVFYVVYTLAGISDVVDGCIARKWKLTSELGAKLDSVADLMFYAMMLLKIFPILLKKIPLTLWIVVCIILVLRACTYCIVAIKFKKFASVHTYLNKLTGLVMFLVPYMIKTPVFVYFCWGISVIAMSAVIQEIVMHIRNKEYCAKIG